MLGKKTVLHSDLFSQIPPNIFYPLIRYSNFSKFDLKEEYLLNLIKQHRKSFDLKNFSGFSDKNTTKNDLIRIVHLFNDILCLGLSEEERGSSSESNVNSIFCNPHYYLDNDKNFEKELKIRWKNITELIYKLEGDYLVISIPSMEIPSKTIEQEPIYYKKFINKLINRILSISKVAERQDVLLLLNYNPLDSIKTFQSNFKTYKNKPHFIDEMLSLNSPFNSFFDYRKFYDSIFQKTENIGMFLDISSYFILDYAKILEFIKDTPQLLEKQSSFESFDRLLLKNPKLGEKLFTNLKKIENLRGLGLNDIKLIKLLIQSNIENLNFQDISKNKQKNDYNNAILSLREKKIIGEGDLPIRSFLYYLKSINPSSRIPDFYSINPQLICNGFNFDVIDWRGIDIDKLKIPNFMNTAIKLFIHDKLLVHQSKFEKKGIPRWKKTEFVLESKAKEENFDTNPLEPPKENISRMQVFSLKKINDSLKEFYNFL